MATRITHGLIIRPEPLDLILAGTKVWEIRGRPTSIRGRIALIEGGSANVAGVAELVEVIGPMTADEVAKNWRKAGYKDLPVKYSAYFAWSLRLAKRLRRAVPYKHPAGAVVWVRLSEVASREIQDAT